MKFPRPKTLVTNEYPDLKITQPALFADLVQNFEHPTPLSHMDSYISASIDFLKHEQKLKSSKLHLHATRIGAELSFIYLTIPPLSDKNKMPYRYRMLKYYTTLIHSRKLNISYKPFNIVISTASGESEDAVQGITHTNFTLYPADNPPKTCCTTIIISNQLNNLDMILGAEFLFNEKKFTVSQKTLSQFLITIKNSLYPCMIIPPQTSQ